MIFVYITIRAKRNIKGLPMPPVTIITIEDRTISKKICIASINVLCFKIEGLSSRYIRLKR
jgi:hypothetical protein